MHTGTDWLISPWKSKVWLSYQQPMVYSITVFVLSGCGWKNLVGIWQPSLKQGIKLKIWRANISFLNLTKRSNAAHSKQIQHGLELVSHVQKITENIRVLSKQISSQRNRWPPWKMFMPSGKQQKLILTINIFYFEISLQYSISCRSWNSAVFHPSSSVVWTSSSQNITLNAQWSSVRREVPHHARQDERLPRGMGCVCKDPALPLGLKWRQSRIYNLAEDIMIDKLSLLINPKIFSLTDLVHAASKQNSFAGLGGSWDHTSFGTSGQDRAVHLEKHHE